jgi:hypothetical protein
MPKCPVGVSVYAYDDETGVGIATCPTQTLPKEVIVLTEAQVNAQISTLLTKVSPMRQIYMAAAKIPLARQTELMAVTIENRWTRVTEGVKIGR